MMRRDVRTLFPAYVVGADSLTVTTSEPLYAEERAHIAGAIDKRQKEFALGRTCARRALTMLGIDSRPLVPHADRSVPWPEGSIGSITHTEGYVAAVAAKSSVLRGLGIDAECKGQVHERLWQLIASDEEQAWFRAAASAEEQALRATIAFSAKEAFYKAQYCVSRAWVGFHDVTFRPGDENFSIILNRAVEGLAAASARYDGRYVLTESHVVSALWIA